MRLRILVDYFLVFPHHKHYILSLGVFVLNSLVGLFMVSPLPLPVGLVPVMGTEGGGEG